MQSSNASRRRRRRWTPAGAGGAVAVRESRKHALGRLSKRIPKTASLRASSPNRRCSRSRARSARSGPYILCCELPARFSGGCMSEMTAASIAQGCPTAVQVSLRFCCCQSLNARLSSGRSLAPPPDPIVVHPWASYSSAARDWRKVLEPMFPPTCWPRIRERSVAFEPSRLGAMPTYRSWKASAGCAGPVTPDIAPGVIHHA